MLVTKPDRTDDGESDDEMEETTCEVSKLSCVLAWLVGKLAAAYPDYISVRVMHDEEMYYKDRNKPMCLVMLGPPCFFFISFLFCFVLFVHSMYHRCYAYLLFNNACSSASGRFAGQTQGEES